MKKSVLQIERAALKVTDGVRMGEERALYGSRGVWVKSCAFDGAEDGESALKECADVRVEDTLCNLRYPFWHDTRLEIDRCELTPLCRAALWYSDHVSITDSRLHGIKALRECADVRMQGCDVISAEFGWSTRRAEIEDCTAEGEYFMLRAEELNIRNFRFKGKYSFQYVQNVRIEDSVLDTKDAFWHAKNVTVRNCTVKGEYLGWYSEDLTLIGCKISGTQPLCYCKGLRLVDCEMIDTDLSFERSEVEATLTAPILSIKNPRAGRIRVPHANDIIIDDPLARGIVLQDC